MTNTLKKGYFITKILSAWICIWWKSGHLNHILLLRISFFIVMLFTRSLHVPSSWPSLMAQICIFRLIYKKFAFYIVYIFTWVSWLPLLTTLLMVFWVSYLPVSTLCLECHSDSRRCLAILLGYYPLNPLVWGGGLYSVRPPPSLGS